jgi:hypothetical protein
VVRRRVSRSRHLRQPRADRSGLHSRHLTRSRQTHLRRGSYAGRAGAQVRGRANHYRERHPGRPAGRRERGSRGSRPRRPRQGRAGERGPAEPGARRASPRGLRPAGTGDAQKAVGESFREPRSLREAPQNADYGLYDMQRTQLQELSRRVSRRGIVHQPPLRACPASPRLLRATVASRIIQATIQQGGRYGKGHGYVG